MAPRRFLKWVFDDETDYFMQEEQLTLLSTQQHPHTSIPIQLMLMLQARALGRGQPRNEPRHMLQDFRYI